MDPTRITPVILCGGAGTRLWPASRESFPKQFLALAGDRTLFQQTVLRVADPARFDAPIVVAHHDHRFIAAEQLEAIGVEALLAIEPARRNSGPALAAAARLAELRDPGAIVIALASDHVVTDADGFRAAIVRGLPAAGAGHIVVFGATATEPTSRYGYIRPGAALEGMDGVAAVAAFVEKPDAETAARFVAEGYLWNSGNFLVQAKTLLAAFDRHAPAVARPARAAADLAIRDLDFLRLDPTSFEAAEALSVDHAVMEATDRAAVVRGDFGWSDVGGWNALWEASPRDERGNALVGPVVALQTRNGYIRSDGPLTAVVGLDDVVVVATGDAVLVTVRDRSEDVKTLVAELVARGEPAATRNPQAHSPWGGYETLGAGPRFQVNRVSVAPGRRLALQTHARRAEHWIVLEGVALVTIGGTSRRVAENQSVHVPAGVPHRLANPGPGRLELIEVRTGDELGADDVVRLDDDYGRP